MSGDRFEMLDVSHAPGQAGAVDREDAVDFSHGDVDAFPPVAQAAADVVAAIASGSRMAYSEYRGHRDVRVSTAHRLAAFTGADIDPDTEIILTPGTQGALFLALSSLVERGEKVVTIEPDYFANRKIVTALGGVPVPARLSYLGDGSGEGTAELDLDEMDRGLAGGAKVVVMSNPNNPTGVVYGRHQLESIAESVKAVGAILVIDQLYSRLVFGGVEFTHARALPGLADSCITLLGPSKTESLSGYRVGAAFGPSWVIDRMEQLQSIVSLRAAGYAQAALTSWMIEPDGWLADRIRRHQAIRDDLVRILRTVPGIAVRVSEAGSYLFPRLPRLGIPIDEFVEIARVSEGVAVTRGGEFGPGVSQSVRLNFSQDHRRAVAAIERLGRLIGRHTVPGGTA